MIQRKHKKNGRQKSSNYWRWSRRCAKRRNSIPIFRCLRLRKPPIIGTTFLLILFKYSPNPELISLYYLLSDRIRKYIKKKKRNEMRIKSIRNTFNEWPMNTNSLSLGHSYEMCKTCPHPVSYNFFILF